jgi:hypothetical protein
MGEKEIRIGREGNFYNLRERQENSVGCWKETIAIACIDDSLLELVNACRSRLLIL